MSIRRWGAAVTGLLWSATVLTADHGVAIRNYDTYCVQCHGIERNGRGVNSPGMSVQPRDHTDAKGMGGLPEAEMFNAIKNGGLAVNKSVLMPAWAGVLDDTEIQGLVAYLRHLCKCGSGQSSEE